MSSSLLKIRKIILILSLFNLLGAGGTEFLIAQTPNTSDPEEVFPNPFLVERFYPIKSISGVTADKHSVGYIDSPENVSIHFKVRGEEVEIPHIPGSRFSYRLLLQNKKGQKKYYNILGDTRYQGDGYFAQLQMPKVDFAGKYDFLITVYRDEEKSTQITRSLPNFFSYRQKKTDVIFLIDNSGSMNRNDPYRLRYREIYKVFRNPEFASKVDELAVISFSDQAQVVFPFGKTVDFLKEETTLGGRGDTDFRKPFLIAERLIREYRRDQDQKAVIFLTDGVANHPYANEHLKLRNLGVPVYTVGLSDPGNRKEYQSTFLKKVAQETRGEFFEAGQDVIGDVFRKFINLSASSTREFVVTPLKKRYAYNELIHINYRSSKNYREGLEMEGYFISGSPIENHEPAEIYQRNSEEIILLPPSLNMGKDQNNGDLSPQKIELRVIFLRKDKIFFDETSQIEIGEGPIETGFIYLKQIDSLDYDIRYFPIVNHGDESLFIDILLPQKNALEGSLTDPIVSFKETPFLLTSGQERNQPVIFHPQNSKLLSQEEKEKTRLIDMVLRTSKGDFISQIHFNYLFQLKKTASFQAENPIDQSQDLFFILIFTVMTAFFLVLLFLKVVENKKNRP